MTVELKKGKTLPIANLKRVRKHGVLLCQTACALRAPIIPLIRRTPVADAPLVAKAERRAEARVEPAAELSSRVRLQKAADTLAAF